MLMVDKTATIEHIVYHNKFLIIQDGSYDRISYPLLSSDASRLEIDFPEVLYIHVYHR